MILGQDILRLVTVRALMGRTWAKDRVFDSPATAADLKIPAERAAPFIGVYTDDADIDLDWQSLHNPDAKVYLLIECAAADRMTIPGQPSGANPSEPPVPQTTISLAQTDQGLELIVGMLARQVTQALLATDNIWAELWRLFTTPGRSRVEVRRGGPGQDERQSAIRYASRIMRFQLSIIADPVYGEGIPEGFWTRFFEVAREDDELGDVAPLLWDHFVTEPGLPSWRIEQKRGTYTLEALQRLGIAPLPQVIGDEAEPPRLTEAMPEQTDWNV